MQRMLKYFILLFIYIERQVPNNLSVICCMTAKAVLRNCLLEFYSIEINLYGLTFQSILLPNTHQLTPVIHSFRYSHRLSLMLNK